MWINSSYFLKSGIFVTYRIYAVSGLVDMGNTSKIVFQKSYELEKVIWSLEAFENEGFWSYCLTA